MTERLTKAAEILPIWFANDIDALTVEEQELEALVERLDKTRAR